MTYESTKLLVLLSGGPMDGGKRATIAFSAACTAVAMGKPTQVFLVGEGSYWAYEGNAELVSLEGFPPLHALMDDFQEFGGELHICSTCDEVCVIAEAPERASRVRKSTVTPRGFASVLSDLEGGVSLSF